MDSPIPLRVLHVTGNPDVAKEIIRELQGMTPGLKTERVADLQGFEEALQRCDFDVAIADCPMAWTEDVAVLQAVKDRNPDCPVIMLTEAGNEQAAETALKSGLDDYIVKQPGYLLRLRFAVRWADSLSRERRRSAQMETRMQSTLDRLNVGVFRCTREGKVLDYNPACLQLLGEGLAADQDPEQSLEAFFSQKECLQFFDRIIQSDSPLELELKRTKSRKQPNWLKMSGSICGNLNGETVIDGFVENVTEQKRMEEQHQQSAVVGAKLKLLSPRECEVLDLVASGKTNKAIAHRLEISVKTVEMHRSKVMKKLRVDNVADLMRLVLAAQTPAGPH